MTRLLKPIPIALTLLIGFTFTASAWMFTRYQSDLAAARLASETDMSNKPIETLKNTNTQQNGCACCDIASGCGNPHTTTKSLPLGSGMEISDTSVPLPQQNDCGCQGAHL